MNRICRSSLSLTVSQAETNCAARVTDLPSSPRSMGSLSSSGRWVKFGQTAAILLKYISLSNAYFLQCKIKCFSVSTSLCWHCEHSLSSLGSQVCLCRPVSMDKLCSLSLYIVNTFLNFLFFTVVW